MSTRLVYRTADVSALSRSLDSAEIYKSAVRYTNLNGIVPDTVENIEDAELITDPRIKININHLYPQQESYGNYLDKTSRDT